MASALRLGLQENGNSVDIAHKGFEGEEVTTDAQPESTDSTLVVNELDLISPVEALDTASEEINDSNVLEELTDLEKERGDNESAPRSAPTDAPPIDRWRVQSLHVIGRVPQT